MPLKRKNTMEVTAEEGKELLGNPFNWGELSKIQAEQEKKEEEAKAEKERKKAEREKKKAKVVPEAVRKSSRIAKKDTEPKNEAADDSEKKPAPKKGKGKKEVAKKEIKRVPSLLAEELAKGNARKFTKENARDVKDSSKTAAKGASLHEELQVLEHAPLDGITFESAPNAQIAGKWQLSYEGYTQDNKLDINEDGTFFQHAGSYKGVWRAAGHLLVLEYSDIKLPGETGSIKLQSELAEGFNTFRGSKSHPNYPKGVLVYVAQKEVGETQQ